MVKTKVSIMWEQQVMAYKASGKTLLLWCNENNVKAARLRYWIREIKAKHATTEKVTSWVSVDTTELKMTTKGQHLTVKIGNASIEVNSDFDKELFSKVTEVLVSLC